MNVCSGDPSINIKYWIPKYQINFISAWLQLPLFSMGYPVMENYLLAKTYQHLFPWMDLTLLSIMSVVIMNQILGAINILSTQYLLANGITDDMIILLVI